MSLTLGVGNKLCSAMNQAPEARPQLSPGWSAAEPWEMNQKMQMSPGGAALLFGGGNHRFQDQGSYHKKVSFQQEYIALLKKPWPLWNMTGAMSLAKASSTPPGFESLN